MPKDWTGNAISVWKANAATNHSIAERQNEDYYATDPIAIDKLLTVEKPNRFIWECACGGGHLSKRLTEKGFAVLSTDIVDRGYNEFHYKADFLTQTDMVVDFNYDILTNPPYRYANEFVLKALELLPQGCKCYMFLKLTFLEGKARKESIFSKLPPRTVYVFSERVKCARNGDFQSLKDSGGSAVAYAWFVWEKGNYGKTEVKWI